MDEKSTEIGEIKDKNNKEEKKGNLKRKKRLLLLCLTSILQPV